MAKKNGMAVKKKLFGLEYLVDHNGARAYRKAYKCSLKSAEAGASRLLKTVEMQAFIQKERAKMLPAIRMSAEEVLSECVRIAQADHIDVFNDDGTVKKIQDIPIHLRRVIKSFKVEEIWTDYEDEDGNVTKERSGRIIDISFWSKDKQLGHLMKFHGMFEKDNDQNRPMSLVDIVAIVMGEQNKKKRKK